MYALGLLALLLPLAAANTHNQCDCMSWSEKQPWIHNAQLTRWVCDSFYIDKASWDENSKLCVATNAQFDGDTWEGYCKAAGYWGYYPTRPDGSHDASKDILRVGAAAGHCPDSV
ncbi:hypothetical protein E4U13_004910 [Claviceps humidiphila]|uniref:Uncharacterized protein n=1 Tax=Claviceps humidiphila TaxID=1294629 RepID=A0A9P7TNU4_9HYPO|nr:hypothetical protein E4U13_004910 [Claviceps humidiphila]